MVEVWIQKGRIPLTHGKPFLGIILFLPRIGNFPIDGERGFMVLYGCSPELNSVATEVRTGVLKVVGLKPIESC